MDWLIALKYLILLVILGIAVYTDLTKYRVYNWLTISSMALGLLFGLLNQGLPGLGQSALGLLVGGLIFFPAFYWGGMGAGDVKLMAAVGSFVGWYLTINAAIYTALAGGVIAVFVLLLQGQLWMMMKSMGHRLWAVFTRKPLEKSKRKNQYLPYALAIGLGTLAAYFLPPII